MCSDLCKDRDCLDLGSLALNTMLKESKLIGGRIIALSRSDILMFTTHLKLKQLLSVLSASHPLKNIKYVNILLAQVLFQDSF